MKASWREFLPYAILIFFHFSDNDRKEFYLGAWSKTLHCHFKHFWCFTEGYFICANIQEVIYVKASSIKVYRNWTQFKIIVDWDKVIKIIIYSCMLASAFKSIFWGKISKGCYFFISFTKALYFLFHSKGQSYQLITYQNDINLLTIIPSVLNLLIVILSSSFGPLDWQVFAQVGHLLAKVW